MSKASYWNKIIISRRRALRIGSAGAGVTALSLVGCGGGSSKKDSGGASTPAAVLDSTKGKPGGKLELQHQALPTSLVFIKTLDSFLHSMAGFVYSGLLEFKHGRPIVSTTDISPDPDLAQALPEQPDELTYIFKLKDAATFQNGRKVTSEDVKYSFEKYAFWDQSAYRSSWPWLDRVDAPDPKTVVVKTKQPFADAITAMTARTDGFVFAKEHEESPEAEKRLMGSGPFLWVDWTPPVSARFKRNPNYWQPPYPYIDEIEFLGASDTTKRVADIISGQVHINYQFVIDERDQVRKARPDLTLWNINYGSHHIIFRADQAPFNDKRVRQALSMSIDRKQIREATSKGEGESDQTLSHAIGGAWDLRKASDMGALAKYYALDIQAAKQLLSAAGVTLPLDLTYQHRDANFLGQGYLDTATLAIAGWRANGIANAKDVTVTAAQSTTTTSVGNYEGLWLSANALSNSPAFGFNLRNHFWSPPEGVKIPTPNVGHVNDAKLSGLVDKQLQQLKFEERKATIRQVEDTLAEEQYRIAHSTWGSYYFTPPTLKNVQIAKYAFSGSMAYAKYWWFDKV